MAKLNISTKRMAISKTNARVVGILGVASFVTVFCLVASKAVFSQNSYQSRVTSKQETAKKNLNDNIKAFNNLVISYNSFNTASTNVLGGNTNGTGNTDGSNAKIILDALPSAYDFPALTSSVEKIVNTLGMKISEINGSDDQVNQQSNNSSPNPQPVSMPFTLTVSSTNYQSIILLLNTLQQSIRPIQIDTLDVSGGTSNMTVTITAHTFYQPAKSLGITKQVIQ